MAHTEMRTLCELPDEILLDVFSYLAQDKPSLCALARVNRRFGNLTPSLIMRDVDLYVEVGNLGVPFTYKLLMRSIGRAYHLASYVRNVTLRWTCSPVFSKGNRQDAHDRANQLLWRLCNIQTLRIDSASADTTPFMPTFLELGKPPHLTEVEIVASQIAAKGLVEYMKLPNIRKISVSFLYSHFKLEHTSHDGSRMNPEFGEESLLLNLGGPDRPALDLFELLQMPSFIAAPVIGTRVGSPSDVNAYFETAHMIHGLSPFDIQRSMISLRSTLVELKLFDGCRTIWPDHDGSRMDLSGFVVLQILHAPSVCFFPSEKPSNDRRGVWKLLPPALKKLSIFFEMGYWFSYETEYMLPPMEYILFLLKDHEPSLAREMYHSGDKTRYEWVTEIIHSKGEHHPLLTHLSITERISGIVGELFENFEEGDFTHDLRREAAEAGIETTISLRKPPGFLDSFTDPVFG